MLRKALLIVVLVALLAGCGSAVVPTNTPVPPTVTPEPTEVPTLGDTQTRSTDGMVMVYVPAGEFEMGSSMYDPAAKGDELFQHTVSLDAFWIDRTEVTNEQYRECVEARTCTSPTTCDWGDPTYGDAAKADHPVVCVDWAGAQAYCGWVGGRLPTEAEWEYAARGPEGWVYPWGNTFDGSLVNYCDTNCEESYKDAAYNDGYAKTAPVGSYLGGASWCGALDMAGNVWEWVADWYGGGWPSDAQTNPTGPATGEYRVLRGGGWDYFQRNVLRAASRHYDDPTRRGPTRGFRCVLSPGD